MRSISATLNRSDRPNHAEVIKGRSLRALAKTMELRLKTGAKATRELLAKTSDGATIVVSRIEGSRILSKNGRVIMGKKAAVKPAIKKTVKTGKPAKSGSKKSK